MPSSDRITRGLLIAIGLYSLVLVGLLNAIIFAVGKRVAHGPACLCRVAARGG